MKRRTLTTDELLRMIALLRQLQALQVEVVAIRQTLAESGGTAQELSHVDRVKHDLDDAEVRMEDIWMAREKEASAKEG